MLSASAARDHVWQPRLPRRLPWGVRMRTVAAGRLTTASVMSREEAFDHLCWPMRSACSACHAQLWVLSRNLPTEHWGPQRHSRDGEAAQSSTPCTTTAPLITRRHHHQALHTCQHQGSIGCNCDQAVSQAAAAAKPTLPPTPHHLMMR